MADNPKIPDFPNLPDFGLMITQACEVVASVRGIPYDFNGTLSLENKFVVLFKTVKEMFDAQDELVKSYKALYDFVNQYFTNLDLQIEVNKKIEEMKDSGELLNLLKPTVNREVTAWLTANITNPSNPPIDKSLTIENAAADAKTTGNRLETLDTKIQDVVTGINTDKILITEIQTSGNYTVNIPNDTGTYIYEIIVKNISNDEGYYNVKRFNGDSYSGSSTGTKLLQPNDAITINTPYTTNDEKIKIENPNNNVTKVIIYKRISNSTGINLLYRYQYVPNEYLSDTDVQAFPPSIIPQNNRSKKLTITNNTNDNAYFIVEIQTNGETVYKTTTALLVHANSKETISIGNIGVQYIFVKNINKNTDFSLMLFEHMFREIVCCGANKKFTKFIDALNYANEKGDCDVYVDAGVYNLVTEIGESNLTNYIFDNTSGHGPYIGNGTRLFMSAGAKVICNYEGSDKTVHRDFAILNVCNITGKGDFAIYGGEFVGKNIRYVIHDEVGGLSQYLHEYHNCFMIMDNTANADWTAKQCIGGGLGKNGKVIINGGIYNSVGIDSDTDNGTITYHNPAAGTSATFKNTVTISNVYFETGTCYVSCLGDDTSADATVFICNNCSAKKEPFANGLDNPEVNHNVTIKKWNNEIRI